MNGCRDEYELRFFLRLYRYGVDSVLNMYQTHADYEQIRRTNWYGQFIKSR